MIIDPAFYLGIDFGTSGARAVVMDAHEQQLAETRYTFGNNRDRTATWRIALFSLIRDFPTELRNQIRGIAIDGTSSTVLLCDRAGNPLDQPLLYNDDRGQAVLPTLQRIAPPDHPVLSATSSLAKLLWWQQQSHFSAARYLLHQADWLAYLLHGQLGVSDYHNSLKLGYDVVHFCYPDWLTRLAIADLLPSVRVPGEAIAPILPSVGEELGLPPDCQVCAGTTDSIAAFLASGAQVPGDAVTSLGSTLVLKLLSHIPVENAHFGIYSHRLGDRWLVGGASNTGGAVLQQFFTVEQLQYLSQQIPTHQESALNYYPLLKPGERFPINDPQLQPRLQPRPSNAVTFLHGLLESMARIEAEGYAQLQALGATPLSCIYTAGGGAANTAWSQIRARQLGVTFRQAASGDAAYGAALLAFRGC
ncbi:carbohydrate kinase [Neosynechococcus sphagnicola sy1]|uniref:D-ribulose kinase n=1 Tax=Neosynechococcus sphagnicola sy1 TaxID=1497020 RepID=A0A098TIF5_9CYAN|nr:FGGY-family carbohydrate kinase [Neosynechococcus sphagnicola]KGF71762.1 carbohydrate kinase [Neosynechococcus sphagnicola sy1]